MFAAGTVFNELIVWSPSDDTVDNSGRMPVLHRLQGHKVVYSSVAFTAGPQVSFVITVIIVNCIFSISSISK